MELEVLKKQIELLKKSYKTLFTAFKGKSLNDLEKDWVIQRFEYTIELSWKTCRKFLMYKKVSFIWWPKDIFKEMFRIGVLDDLELWENFLDIRNAMSHMYSEYVSENSFEYIKNNYEKIQFLIDEKWKTELKLSWILKYRLVHF